MLRREICDTLPITVENASGQHENGANFGSACSLERILELIEASHFKGL